MARKRRNRDVTTIASAPLASVRTSWPSLLSAIEDRRLYHPVSPAPAKTFTTKAAADVLGSPVRKGPLARSTLSADFFKFRQPKAVAICVRRKQRREVLFASGKGGKGWRRKRRNAWSDVHC